MLGELGWEDRARDRKSYLQRMEERAREDVDDENLKHLRSGWLLGDEAFRDKVIDWMEKRCGEKRRKIRREETDDDHGQRQAERIIERSLQSLGLSDEELRQLRKGDWRKRAIAHKVRSKTSVSLRWIAKRLAMGSDGYVSRISSNVEDIAGLREWRKYQNDLK